MAASEPTPRHALAGIAARSGGFYWHPCRQERKPARLRNDQESHKSLSLRHAFALAPGRWRGSIRRHADRPLRARHPAEHRHDSAALRLPRHRGPYHRAGRLSGLRPRLPPRRHGLSRPGRARAARLLARRSRTGGAPPARGSCCSPPRRERSYLDHAYDAERRPAVRPRIRRRAGRRSTRQPTPGSSSRCGPACARSMWRWPAPWRSGEALRQTGPIAAE